MFRLIRGFISTYFPQSIVSFLKKVRYFYFANIKGFHHNVAQKGEFESAMSFMKSNDDLVPLLNKLELLRNRRMDDHLVQQVPFIRDFFRDIRSYKRFCKEIDGKRSLEVGSGPIGTLVLMPWIAERIIIEPLAEKYRKFQIELFGKTFFTSDIEVYSQNAETFIPSLKGSITGFIVSRNALDHCEDPWLILDNISRYAASECKLLLWTDLWHLGDIGDKHRNITKNKDIFESKLIDLGFRIESRFSDVRNDDSTIEYGCIATKI